MRTISNLNPERLKLDEHISFLNRVAEATRLLSVETAEVENFLRALQDYKASLIVNSTVMMTAELNAIDKTVNKLWVLLRDTAKASTGFAIDEIRLAAQEVYNIVIDIGDPRRKPVNDRVGILARLFNQLDTLGEKTLKQALTDNAAEKLRENYNLFVTKYAERHVVKSNRLIGVAAVKRVALNNAYTEMIQRINALAIVNGEAEYKQFIVQVDQDVVGMKFIVNQRKRNYGNNQTDDNDKTNIK